MTSRARFSHLFSGLSVLAIVAAAPAFVGCGGGPGAKSAESAPSAKLAPRGYAVLARPAVKDAGWSLAQHTYRSERLRPRLDEPTARVLAGEAAPAGRRDLRDLEETRDAIGDDTAPSRKLLAALAKDLGLEGVLVVASAPSLGDGSPSEGRAMARVFEAETGSFSPVEVRPGEGGAWDGAVASLERLAPPLTRDQVGPKPVARVQQEGKSKAFYESPWFWGAAGAAAVLGGVFFLSTRDSASDSIHVQMQVPR